nr:hypothetical protein [Tanacetum cinerariifolium]
LRNRVLLWRCLKIRVLRWTVLIDSSLVVWTVLIEIIALKTILVVVLLSRLVKSRWTHLSRNILTILNEMSDCCADNLKPVKVQDSIINKLISKVEPSLTNILPSTEVFINPLVPQDRWSREKHIDLVNIIREPLAGVTTKSKIRNSKATSAHECLCVNFLSEIEPNKLIKVIKEEGWIIAMPEELNKFEKNKGFRKEEGINYDETFAHVARLEAIVIFFAYATYMGFMTQSMLDVTYIERIPQGMSILGGKLVCWSAKKQSSMVISSAEAEEFWYTTEVESTTNTITFTLSSFDKPETVRAALATLGLVDENEPQLSSTDLVNSSPLRIRSFSATRRVLMLYIVKCLGQMNINQQMIADVSFCAVIAPEPDVSIGTPSSTTIDQDAPSSSTFQKTQETPPLVIPLDAKVADHDFKVAHIDNNPYVDFPILEPSFEKSSTQLVIPNNVHSINQPPEHINKWTKDHPINNSYKEALTESCWIGAMQEKLSEFERLEVWEMVPCQTAFLNGILCEEVYVSQPDGFIDPENLNHVYKLKKDLYEKSTLDEDPQGKAVDPTRYRGMIGTLIYRTSSRPDLAFTVCMCAWYQARPIEKNLHVVLKMLTMWVAKIPEKVRLEVCSVRMLCSNTLDAITINLLWPCVQQDTSDQVENGVVKLYFVRREYQLADIFTKPLARERLDFLINKLGMRSISPETLQKLADEEEQMILDICPRVEGVDFTDEPDDDATLACLIKLGYKEFNYIPFEEKPQILLQAWYKFFTIQYAQPEDSNELFQKLLEDLKELAEYVNSPSSDHPIFFNEDHSVQHKEYLENSSNSNQEKEGPPQDFDIRQEKHEVKNVVEQPADHKTRIEKSLQNFRVIHKSFISLKITSQISPVHAITPILSTKEPEYSPSMGYENPNTTLETESDEIIKSGVEELVPILSKNEVILEDKSDDDDFEDIEYIEASLPDPEIVSVEEDNVVHQEEEEFDFEDVFQIQDIVLREKLLSINRLIANIESLNDNPTPDRVLNSSFSFPISEESDNSLSDNFSQEFKTFCDHTKETRSGNTTTHADHSLPEYDSFCFEIEPDQERLINVIKNDISDDSSNDPLLEEADLFLASDNSIPPGNENFAYDLKGELLPLPHSEPPDAEFDFELDSGKEISVVMNAIDKSSQMFIKYSNSQIPPKKSRDVALELGKSISKTKAEEAEAARQVHTTHVRIMTESVPKPTKRRKSGKVTSDPPKRLKGVPSLTQKQPEVADTMQALKENGDADDEGDDHISDTQDDDDDEDAETESDEYEIYKYKIHVHKDVDAEMAEPETAEHENKEKDVLTDAAKHDVEKNAEEKGDAEKARVY